MNAYDVAVVPIIMGLVEVAKQVGLPTRFASLLALALGVAAGIFLLFPHEILKGVLVGITFGLAASGLYSGGKSTARTIRARRQARAREGTLAIRKKNGRV